MRWLLLAVAVACTARHEPRNEWAQRPTTLAHGRVGTDALGFVDYSLAIPQGLSASAHDHYGSDDVTAPAIAIAFNALPPRNLDAAREAALAAAIGDEQIVSADAIPAGFRVDLRSSDRKHWAVEVFALTDRGFSVDCLAQQASADELGDATRQFLGKICMSLQLPRK